MTGLECIINVCQIRNDRNLGDVDMFKNNGKYCFNIYVYLDDTVFSKTFLRKSLIPLTKTFSKVKLNSNNEDIRNIVKEFFILN